MTDIRCPAKFNKLFMRIVAQGEPIQIQPDGNLIQVTCYDCKREAKKVNPQVIQYYHLYNLLGELVSSEEETED